MMKFGDKFRLNHKHAKIPQIRKDRQALPTDKLSEFTSAKCRDRSPRRVFEWEEGAARVVVWKSNTLLRL